MQEAIKQTELQTEQPFLARFFPNNEWVLIAVLLFEIGLFSVIGNNFFSSSNGFEITRLAVEIGLLALAYYVTGRLGLL
ncbi:MAG: hypothetical protein AAB336_05205, partial [Acidobacteriota bacterium]